MSNDIDAYDYQRYAILFVDDEANTRKYFRRLFGEKFRILEAGDGVEAMAVFREHAGEIGIIVTDQRMPNETGVAFLSKIAGDYPDIIKILSTAYSDIDAAIGSVNQGGIFRYITKPWDIPQLEVTLRRAMEFFTVKRERDALLDSKLKAMGTILLSSRLAAFALAPVCAKIPSRRVAKAISTFVEIGVAAHRSAADAEIAMSSTDWVKIHSSQVPLAAGLEARLPIALAVNGLPDRIVALTSELHAAGASVSSKASGIFNRLAELKAAGATVSAKSSGIFTRLVSPTDPTASLLDALVGKNSDPSVVQAAINVLAAIIAIYDADGIICRIQSEGLTLDITVCSSPPTTPNPGGETAKWLLEDDRLILAALGLL
jgi:CheY-like chemotaxis protein